MAVREIVVYAQNPDPLRRKCDPVRVVNRRVRRLIHDLKDTLNAHSDGVGLASPKIDEHLRVVLVRLCGGNNREQEP